jgi:hypothetical protein
MPGFDDFERAVYIAYRPYMQRVLQEHGDEVLQRHADAAAGRPLPDAPDYGASRDERFVIKLLGYVAEIRASYESLLDVAAFLRRYPYINHPRLTQERYVRYHVEHLYQEMYILKSRVEAFGSWLQRAYRKSAQRDIVSGVTVVITRLLSDSTAHMTRVRGRHVHEARLDDSELRRMYMLQVVATAHVDLARVVRKHQRRRRVDAARWAREECKSVKVALDVSFGILRELIIDKDTGQLHYPQ